MVTVDGETGMLTLQVDAATVLVRCNAPVLETKTETGRSRGLFIEFHDNISVAHLGALIFFK